MSTPNWIKAELAHRGIRQSDIARHLDRDVRTVNSIVNGHARSRYVEEEIARRLGIPRDEIFPVRRTVRTAA